jgi:hypothetical protein
VNLLKVSKSVDLGGINHNNNNREWLPPFWWLS